MGSYLSMNIGGSKALLPLVSVREVLRPQPLTPPATPAPGLLGVALIRGEPSPVLDLRVLLGMPAAHGPTRLVDLRVGARRVALAVDGVEGVVQVDPGALRDLPPLLRDAAHDALGAIVVRDGALASVLSEGRLWEAAGGEAARAQGGAA